MTVLDGQSQITNCMFEILAQEAQEEQGKIQIFMDPDFSSIIDYLASLAVGTTACRLSISSAWITPNS